jgi:hypothetical protein
VRLSWFACLSQTGGFGAGGYTVQPLLNPRKQQLGGENPISLCATDLLSSEEARILCCSSRKLTMAAGDVLRGCGGCRAQVTLPQEPDSIAPGARQSHSAVFWVRQSWCGSDAVSIVGCAAVFLIHMASIDAWQGVRARVCYTPQHEGACPESSGLGNVTLSALQQGGANSVGTATCSSAGS